MSDYTNVPVPNYLVMDVLRFIAAAEEGAGAQSHGSIVAHAGYSEEGRQWSADELAFIWDNRERYVSVGKFAIVMELTRLACPTFSERRRGRRGSGTRRAQPSEGPRSVHVRG